MNSCSKNADKDAAEEVKECWDVDGLVDMFISSKEDQSSMATDENSIDLTLAETESTETNRITQSTESFNQSLNENQNAKNQPDSLDSRDDIDNTPADVDNDEQLSKNEDIGKDAFEEIERIVTSMKKDAVKNRESIVYTENDDPCIESTFSIEIEAIDLESENGNSTDTDKTLEQDLVAMWQEGDEQQLTMSPVNSSTDTVVRTEAPDGEESSQVTTITANKLPHKDHAEEKKRQEEDHEGANFPTDGSGNNGSNSLVTTTTSKTDTQMQDGNPAGTTKTICYAIRPIKGILDEPIIVFGLQEVRMFRNVIKQVSDGTDPCNSIDRTYQKFDNIEDALEFIGKKSLKLHSRRQRVKKKKKQNARKIQSDVASTIAPANQNEKDAATTEAEACPPPCILNEDLKKKQKANTTSQSQLDRTPILQKQQHTVNGAETNSTTHVIGNCTESVVSGKHTTSTDTAEEQQINNLSIKQASSGTSRTKRGKRAKNNSSKKDPDRGKGIKNNSTIKSAGREKGKHQREEVAQYVDVEKMERQRAAIEELQKQCVTVEAIQKQTKEAMERQRVAIDEMQKQHVAIDEMKKQRDAIKENRHYFFQLTPE